MSAAPSPRDGRKVVDGLFERDAAGEIRLIGTRCASCGASYFPEAVSCRNPDCTTKAVERVQLPTRGIVHSFTVQRYQPPAPFRMDSWKPYALALVDLGDGLLVMGMMRDVDLDGLAIGITVRLVETSLYVDGDASVTSFAFAPDGPR